jgi:hypothetical protein
MLELDNPPTLLLTSFAANTNISEITACSAFIAGPRLWRKQAIIIASLAGAERTNDKMKNLSHCKSPWHAVLIDEYLSSRTVGQAETVAECALGSGVSFTDAEIERAKRAEIPLTEENVETLLTAAFGHVFKTNDLMLIARQRALFQIPDLVAIDRLGRLTIVEVKNKPAKAIEIVSQVSEYLVQCAERNSTQLTWLMQDYYRRYVNFHPLYHAALLLRKSIEHHPGLGRFLRENGVYPDQMRDSALGGDKYFRRMKDVAKPFIQSGHGVNIEGSLGRVLSQIRGDLAYAESDLVTALQQQFGYGPSQRSAVEQTLNRRWHQIYFAPSFWFQRKDQEATARHLTAALAKMYLRGMEMSFIEYRLVCKSKHSPPWLLAWRETIDWLASINKNGSALKWRNATTVFDRYTANMLSSGYVIKKEPGRYETWHVVHPDRDGLVVEWPLGRNPDRLSAGCVRFQRYHPDVGQLRAIEDRVKQATSEFQCLSVRILYKGEEPRFEWESADGGDISGFADIASAITSAILN